MAKCERCGLSKWFLSLSDNGLCPACAEAELKEAAEKSHAPPREIDQPAQTPTRSDSPTADSLERVPSLQESPIPRFDNYVGQEEIKKDVLSRVEAAVHHSRPFPHFLLSGPPEMGKATLAHLIAREMKVKITSAHGAAVKEPVDLAPLRKNLAERDFFLIEQI